MLAHELAHTLQRVNVVARQQAPAQQQPSYQIVHGADFHQTQDGVSLDATLLANATSMCNYLIENQLVSGNITFTQGVRSPVTAHRWSTAYAIRHGTIPLANLQALQDGRDLDGNLWYQAGWTQQQIIANAQSIWNGALAAEGYPQGDSRRLPNTAWTNVSNHVDGQAMDISIPWTIGAWSAQANTIVADHGLSRPVPSESWHFQLA